MTDGFVFDVTAANFEQDVVARSQEVPVLLDFWADWCGPCKALTPILEKLVAEYNGAFLLAKVNTEAEQELAYAFRVQSIPFCVLLAGGRPVDAFQGALDEGGVREFLERCNVKPGEAQDAEEPEDPDTPEARLSTALEAILRGDAETARERLGGITEEEPQHARAQRILSGLEFMNAELQGDTPAVVALRQGRDAFLSGDVAGGVEAFVESVAADRSYGSELARRAAVVAFEVLSLEPAAEDFVGDLRRRLATLMY